MQVQLSRPPSTLPQLSQKTTLREAQKKQQRDGFSFAQSVAAQQKKQSRFR